MAERFQRARVGSAEPEEDTGASAFLGEAASLFCAQVPARDLLPCCLDAVVVKGGLAVGA